MRREDRFWKMVARAERRNSVLSRLLNAIASRPMVEALLPDRDSPAAQTANLSTIPNDDLRQLIRDAIHEIAERCRAVIVAHAASFALGSALAAS